MHSVTAMPTHQTDPVAIAIFAKAPIEGFAKTRLIPRLGAKGAADLQRRLVERAVQVASAADVGPISLWCAPDGQHETFVELERSHGITLRNQPAGDLGTRMCHAFTDMTPALPTLLMGTDCAVITPHHLKQCATLLRGDTDAVFVPVEDGGYILVGLKKIEPSLFERMPWGSSTVMQETESRARAAGLTIAKLEPLWDIDRANDYDRARRCGAL